MQGKSVIEDKSKIVIFQYSFSFLIYQLKKKAVLVKKKNEIIHLEVWYWKEKRLKNSEGKYAESEQF